MTGRRIQRGSVSIYLVLAMVVLTGSLALTVDTGFVWQAYGQLQFAADAAALAAAAELMDPTVLYAQDPSPEVQSALREQRIAAARQQALTLAALNSADGSPVRLDANLANSIEGDVVVGWVESADSSGQLVPWPAVEGVNSVLIHARRSRAGGDPVPFPVRPRAGLGRCRRRANGAGVGGPAGLRRSPRGPCSCAPDAAGHPHAGRDDR